MNTNIAISTTPCMPSRSKIGAHGSRNTLSTRGHSVFSLVPPTALVDAGSFSLVQVQAQIHPMPGW
jgi:hypothetical protein